MPISTGLTESLFQTPWGGGAVEPSNLVSWAPGSYINGSNQAGPAAMSNAAYAAWATGGLLTIAAAYGLHRAYSAYYNPPQTVVTAPGGAALLPQPPGAQNV